MSYLRFIDEKVLQNFKPENCTSDFQVYSKLIPVSEIDPEAPVSGYIPYHTAVYIRSTGNDVIVPVHADEPMFYGTYRLQVQDPAMLVTDEALIIARKYLETVLTKEAFNDTSLPFKSFPCSRGGTVLTTMQDGVEKSYGAYLFMSVIVEQDYFNSLELNEGYEKRVFRREDYLKGVSDDSSLTAKLAYTFVKVHKPNTGGTV